MNLKEDKPFIVGIAGGTASGKTTFARRLHEASHKDFSQIIVLDAYYKCLKHLPMSDRVKNNYDHPDAFEINLLIQQLKQLLAGEAVHMPVYDFSTHTRSEDVTIIHPSPVIIIEGILTLYFEEILQLCDLTLFIDAPDQLRLRRRIDRDVKERGRTRESVQAQWTESVQASFIEFCLPTKSKVDRIVSGDYFDEEILNEVCDEIRKGVPHF